MRIFRELMIILSILFLYSCEDIMGLETCDEGSSNWPECLCVDPGNEICGDNGVTYCSYRMLKYLDETVFGYMGECE